MAITMLLLLIGAALLPMAAHAADDVPARPLVGPTYVPFLPDAPDPRIGERSPDLPVTTLSDAVALTYWNNPTLLSQRASLRGTDYRYPAARSAAGPTMDVQIAHSYQRDRQEVIAGFFNTRSGWATTASLILNQPLYTFGRNRGAQKFALADVAFGRDSLKLAETQVLLDSITAYISLQRETALVAIAEENLALLDRQYADNKERFRVREITSTDLQQIETRVELGRAQLTQAQGQYGVSRSRFIQTVGGMPGELAPPAPLPVDVATLDDAYGYAELHGPVYRAAQSREKISRASLEVAKAQYGPRIDLRGTLGLGTSVPYSNDLRTSQLRGEVVYQQQLIDSGLREAQIREAREANDADWRLIDGALRDTRQAIASSWKQLSAARASLGNYGRAVDAARRAYDGAVTQEKAGARTTLDVLDLARDLLNVRTNYVTVLASEYISRATLLAAMGRLEPQLLVPDLKTYDTTEHFDKVKDSGDVPLLTEILSTFDGVTSGDIDDDKPIRDTAGRLANPGTMPMEPESKTPPLTADGVPVIVAPASEQR